MFSWLNNLSIKTRSAISVLLFICVLTFATYNSYTSIGANIEFAEQEKLGNYYQRPLASILYNAGMLETALGRGQAGKSATGPLIANISKGMSDLKIAQDTTGAALQFTDEGLASRDRSHLSYDNVLAKWQAFESKATQASAAGMGADLASFIGDIRGIIAHSGDTSNLILDPDLDSYYLMDVTLLALPQTINRIGDIGQHTFSLLTNPLDIGKSEQIKFSTDANMLNESDVIRITADFDTSFKEDPNFHGVSPTYAANIKPLLESYSASNKSLADTLGRLAQGETVTPEEFQPKIEAAINSANALWIMSFDELDIMLQKRIDSYRHDQFMSIVWSLVGLFISIIFYSCVVQSVVSPLKEMTHIMKEISQNNFEIEIPYRTSKSEIGSIAQTLAVFKDALIKNRNMAESEKSEQSKKEQRQRKIQVLITNFDATASQTVSTVATASNELSQTAESMSKIANDTNHRSVEVASASERASHNVQSVASAAEEMAATIQEISRQISMSNNIVSDAMNKAEAADRSSQELVQMSRSVGDIATMIENIAGQINLLALNATIESARSGEAGKGFAVVANEVKNLATQTAKATEQIRQQLEGVQTTASGVANSLGLVREAIAKVDKNSAAIADAVQQQSAATQEIVTNMTTATQGVEQINGGISVIKSGTDSTTVATQQVLEAARMLSTQAEKMDSEVKTFLRDILTA